MQGDRLYSQNRSSTQLGEVFLTQQSDGNAVRPIQAVHMTPHALTICVIPPSLLDCSQRSQFQLVPSLRRSSTSRPPWSSLGKSPKLHCSPPTLLARAQGHPTRSPCRQWVTPSSILAFPIVSCIIDAPAQACNPSCLWGPVQASAWKVLMLYMS